MKGGKNRQPLGYTIVEVIIVLGVSGVMFLIAATFINGKQQRASFTAGTNQMASQIQDVIEQVTDGKFSDIPLNCSFSGGSVAFTNPTAAAQGTGTDCVFLGKLLSFKANANNYVVSSLAAGRDVTSPTLGNVDPTVIPGLDDAQTIPQGLDVSCVELVDSTSGATIPCNTYYNFGFAQGLGNVTDNGSGAQTVSLVYSPVANENAANDNITGSLNYASSATLCLTDGTQTAKLTIGGNTGSQLGVNTQIGASCP